MSKISTIFDRILVELAALYPSATKIPYPYDLIRNDDNFLRLGYGLKVGPSNPIQLDFCKNAFERNFTIILTREVYNTGSNDSAYDDIVKGLLEDIYAAQDRFNEPDQIAIESDIVKIDFVGAGGAEQIDSENKAFLTMEATFNFIIQENI
jgi:hypothetical protein